MVGGPALDSLFEQIYQLLLFLFPEYLLQHQMEVLTALIRRKLEQKKVSLRFLARELGTSDNQIQRLLNPNILNKNLTQLSKIAVLLGLEVEVRLKGAA